jgi:hypothetical protein
MRHVYKSVGVALLLVLITVACSKQRQWKEEVSLSDGRKVLVERGVTFGARNFEPGQSLTGAVNYWLKFVNPGNGQSVRWEDPGKLMPMILGIAHGIPYLVALPVSSSAHIEAGCPRPGYLFFRYENAWEPIRYSELPPAMHKRNLLLVYLPAESAVREARIHIRRAHRTG